MTPANLQSPALSSPGHGGAASVFDKRLTIVCALLIVLSGGIFWLSQLRVRLPIPWPKDPVMVQVDKDFVLTSFPDQLPEVTGRYLILSHPLLGEHRLTEAQAKPRLNEETRLALNVGEPMDAPRLKDRASNWYMTRHYVDTDAKTPPSLRLWQLDLTYYTGEADTVAHVPGRCMVAAGGRPVGQDKVLNWNLPPNALGWKTAQVIRQQFEMTKEGRTVTLVQYYTFCVNGVNEPLWPMVRYTLRTALWQKYVYFGKMQFAPSRVQDSFSDIEQADEAAREFFTSFVASALSTFPTADQVYLLNHPPKAEKP